MKNRSISPQAFLEAARPSLPALYQTALLITDSAELSETALSRALSDVYSARSVPRERRALSQALSKAARDAAFELLASAPLNDVERGDWRGATGVSVVTDAALSALFGHFCAEELGTQRVLLLRYGCGLSAQRAAEAAGIPLAAAKEAIARFKARAAGQNAEAFERALSRMCRMLAVEPGGAPDLSAVCRAFERDAVVALRETRGRRNVPGYILCVLGVLICALLFWLVAVLLEPSGGSAPARVGSAAGEYALYQAEARFPGWV